MSNCKTFPAERKKVKGSLPISTASRTRSEIDSSDKPFKGIARVTP